MGNKRVIDSDFIKECKSQIERGDSVANVSMYHGVAQSTIYNIKKANFDLAAYKHIVKTNDNNFKAKTIPKKVMPGVLVSFSHTTLFSRTDYVVMTDGVVLKCKNGNVISLIDNNKVIPEEA